MYTSYHCLVYRKPQDFHNYYYPKIGVANQNGHGYGRLTGGFKGCSPLDFGACTLLFYCVAPLDFLLAPIEIQPLAT